MAFKVRNKRNDDGTYTLSYGKGKNKLTASMFTDAGGKWYAVSGIGAKRIGPCKTMKECKVRWGEWAAVAYDGSGSKGKAETPASTPPSTTPSTTPPRVAGPPRVAPSGPPSVRPAGPPRTTPAMPGDVDFQFAADPFDPRYKYPSDHDDAAKQRKLTPLGVLVEIDAWCRRHEAAIQNVEAFKPLVASVRACLHRELCEDTSDVEA